MHLTELASFQAAVRLPGRSDVKHQGGTVKWKWLIRLKVAVFPLFSSVVSDSRLKTNNALLSVICAILFSEPPQERQTRQQQKSSSPDRQKVRLRNIRVLSLVENTALLLSEVPQGTIKGSHPILNSIL